jgi:AcrR family transcriptional regulator
VQARALRRRELLLDATARVLDRVGYDGLTTNAVAKEASTGVGTVYEYFPSREALVTGLLERYAVRLGGMLDHALSLPGKDLPAKAWPEMADRIVDAFARFWREEPGYRAAWSATQIPGLLQATGAAWSDAFTERIAQVLAGLAASKVRARHRVIARTAVHLVSGLVLAAIESPPRRRNELLFETKVALRAYLGARLASMRD